MSKNCKFFPENYKIIHIYTQKQKFPNFSHNKSNKICLKKTNGWNVTTIFGEKQIVFFGKEKENLHQDDEKQRLKIHDQKNTF